MVRHPKIVTLLNDPICADSALRDSLADWSAWLATERRFSGNTVNAYLRDIKYFLYFVANHIGASPTLSALQNLRTIDFRAWLADRANDGLKKTTIARALSVVRYMTEVLGFPPERLAANGFGEFQPIDPRDTEEAKARNRRIELKLTER